MTSTYELVIRASLLTIEPKVCTTSLAEHPQGYCYSRQDCALLNGTSADSCDTNYGFCCTFSRTCGGSTLTNITSFVNPSYPSVDKTSGDCSIEVALISNNICQLRLDLQKFVLAQPNLDGVCDTDYLSVSGTANDADIPRICGTNSGQHIYVNVDPTRSPKIIMKTGASEFERSWNIIITQIDCNSPKKAPDGCLQYHSELTGVVESFNYRKPTNIIEIDSNQVQRHLANLNYAVCLARMGGCKITWTPSQTESPYAFIMSGDAKTDTVQIV
ncbi:uncharacterized protein LOC108670403 [Hyalella azteca]|uniref:Uncharacterized protein LOC108670403 n=1 Tax=Hyalella azteca TaxID=294128 RepID=A0A8B7NI97_HYAAZ|nr:uncharacterized protein LOC108670403 [Hyalella azteca]